VVDEAGAGDLRECFTVEDVLQLSCHPEQVLALPLTRPSPFSIRSRVTLRMPDSSE
jgi:hypothetical protein